MRGSAPHPDFVAASARRRWRGRPLRELWAELTRWAENAAQTMDGADLPIWYVLEGGALVAMDYDGAGRRVLRIARSSTPDDGGTAFRRECDVFIKHFGCTDWTAESDPAARGIAIVYHEPVSLFHSPTCACGAELDPAARLYGGGERCSTCAAAAKRHAATCRTPEPSHSARD